MSCSTCFRAAVKASILGVVVAIVASGSVVIVVVLRSLAYKLAESNCSEIVKYGAR